MTRRTAWQIVLLLGLFWLLPTAAATAEKTSDTKSEVASGDLDRHTLIYGGDLFCARRLNFALLAPSGEERNKVLAAVAPLFKEADLAMINLEGMVTTGGYYNRLRRCSYVYRAHPNVVDMLKNAGVDLVTIGNNHNGDYGPEAQIETVDQLAAAGIGYVGAGVDLEDAMRPVYRQ
ncbi:MAG: CapA family protein, partial [Pirellulales bacterium]|nr:CapA family protein [Pirellulales bacterium]